MIYSAYLMNYAPVFLNYTTCTFMLLTYLFLSTSFFLTPVFLLSVPPISYHATPSVYRCYKHCLANNAFISCFSYISIYPSKQPRTDLQYPYCLVNRLYSDLPLPLLRLRTVYLTEQQWEFVAADHTLSDLCS
jgi:hypothetical protein